METLRCPPRLRYDRRTEHALAPTLDTHAAHALWGNVAVTQAYLTLCEVLGHVDLLVERGAAVEEEVGGVVRYAAAS